MRPSYRLFAVDMEPIETLSGDGGLADGKLRVAYQFSVDIHTKYIEMDRNSRAGLAVAQSEFARVSHFSWLPLLPGLRYRYFVYFVGISHEKYDAEAWKVGNRCVFGLCSALV